MRPLPRRVTLGRSLLVAALCALVATTGHETVAPDEQVSLSASGNRVTPGNFTGYGFDQCKTPTQEKMDAWLRSSPFLAVGIYISGASRGCRDQPNLTPTWVSTQLRNGWRLLPITLGPQASCHPSFPRYGNDPRINPDPTDSYAKARAQGRVEAGRAVAAAQALGIVPGSTLWYDLEGTTNLLYGHCRESALRFVSAWTTRLHTLGYVSGFYSSAGSGIKILDDARVQRPGVFSLPDYLWLARWDGVANTTTETKYLRADGWTPHRRVKQYQGGHNETWGGVTINIDRNFLDVGRGSVAATETHCGGVAIDYLTYETLVPRTTLKSKVSVVQCLLKEQGYWTGGLKGWYGKALSAAIQRWQVARGLPPTTTWSRRHWVSLLSHGSQPIIKFGSAGRAVRRLQRALNANGAAIPVTGVFTRTTDRALRDWQRSIPIVVSGVASAATWTRLNRGM